MNWNILFVCLASSPDFTQSLFKRVSIELVMLSNNLILHSSLLLLPSIFPSIRVFSNKLALPIRWPKYWSSNSGSVLPVNSQDWFPFWLTDLICLQSKGLSRIFSSILPKQQFFSAQPSLWSKSHIYTWLQEKPYLLLDGPLLTK